MLGIGFVNTTVLSAYFRRLNSLILHQSTPSRQVPFSLVTRHAGT